MARIASRSSAIPLARRPATRVEHDGYPRGPAWPDPAGHGRSILPRSPCDADHRSTPQFPGGVAGPHPRSRRCPGCTSASGHGVRRAPHVSWMCSVDVIPSADATGDRRRQRRGVHVHAAGTRRPAVAAPARRSGPRPRQIATVGVGAAQHRQRHRFHSTPSAASARLNPRPRSGHRWGSTPHVIASAQLRDHRQHHPIRPCTTRRRVQNEMHDDHEIHCAVVGTPGEVRPRIW